MRVDMAREFAAVRVDMAKEFAAVRAMFEDSCEYPALGDPNDYAVGTIPAVDSSGVHLVALTLLKEMGNNSAAAGSGLSD